MPHIGRGWPVLTGEIVRLGRERAEAVRIAFRVIEHIEASQRQVLVNSRIEVDDQLVLVVKTSRLHQENGARMAERKHAAARHQRIICPRQRRIDVFGAQQVQSVRIRVGHGDGRIEWQLAFETDGGLHDVRRAQRGTDLLDRSR